MAYGLVANADPSLEDPVAFKRWTDKYPSGTSMQSIIHYGQIKHSGEFIEYQKPEEKTLGKMVG